MLTTTTVKKTNRFRKNRPKQPVSKAVATIDGALQVREFGKVDVCRFPGVGFPDQLRCVLKYVEHGIAFTGSPTPAAQVFRINSLFDPDLTSTGHQPNQFDQLSALYGQYCVMAARVLVEFQNEGTAFTKLVMVYSDVNTSTQSTENLAEARWARETYAAPALNGRSLVRYTMPTVDISMLQGEKNMNSDPNVYAGIGSNPVDPAYFIFKCSAGDSVTNVTGHCDFTLWFNCWFKELTPVTES